MTSIILSMVAGWSELKYSQFINFEVNTTKYEHFYCNILTTLPPPLPSPPPWQDNQWTVTITVG